MELHKPCIPLQLGDLARVSRPALGSVLARSRLCTCRASYHETRKIFTWEGRGTFLPAATEGPDETIMFSLVIIMERAGELQDCPPPWPELGVRRSGKGPDCEVTHDNGSRAKAHPNLATHGRRCIRRNRSFIWICTGMSAMQAAENEQPTYVFSRR